MWMWLPEAGIVDAESGGKAFWRNRERHWHRRTTDPTALGRRVLHVRELVGHEAPGIVAGGVGGVRLVDAAIDAVAHR